jgi:hypothetical protein
MSQGVTTKFVTGGVLSAAAIVEYAITVIAVCQFHDVSLVI